MPIRKSGTYNLVKVDRHISNIKIAARSFFDLVLSLLYPKFCQVCGRYGQFVCFDCYSKIEIARTDTCFVCGRISKDAKLCSACQKRGRVNVESIYWVGSYHDDVLKALIHALKYDGVLELSDVLAEALCQRIKNLVEKHGDLVVVPVPLHPKKQSTRGFNQAELIARYISGKYGLTGGLALQRVRETDSQVSLNKQERQENLSGAIVCNDLDLVAGQKILLIDDVATTGATLGECARALKEAGARKIFAATVARD